MAECEWNQKRLAELVRVHAKTVGKHLSGKRRPSSRVLERYAEAFQKGIGRSVTAADLTARR
jgi:hypothetical protein